MTYSRGHHDDEYGRDRRPRRDVPERDERRSGGGSSRYSRSSERYARHSSAQRGEERAGRSGSRQNRQRRDDSSRLRYRDELEGRRDVPRSAQRPASRARQYDDGHDEGYERSSNARSSRQRDAYANRQRDGRAERQRDARGGQYAGARAGQRNVAQATQYSRDRYVSQPGQQRGSSVSQQNYERARRAKPVDPRMIFALGIVALILAAVIIIRFVTFGGVASEYGAAKAAIDQQQTQLTELETSNGELQAEIDSMQGLIDRYNNSGKK